MSEQRQKILGMLSEGKITVDEADKLLEALKNGAQQNAAVVQEQSVSHRLSKLKYLRVVVDSVKGDNVNIKVPVAILRAGIKLSSLIPPQAYQKLNEKMTEKGVDVDINQILKNGDFEELIESLGDLNVDVNSKDGDKVKVFFE
jgi:DNA-binding transcriptional ArsR family regulator